MVDRFVEYVSSGPTKRVHVGKYVLFGDRMDVRVKNAGKPNESSGTGGTIRYQLKKSSEAISGYYQHGRILLKGDRYSHKRYLHLIHHEAMDGAEIGKYLCSVDGHDGGGFRDDPNVFSRYDWCHYRNWGDYSGDEEEEEEDRFMKMFFVSVKAVVPAGETGNGKVPFEETARLELETDCIEGDWNYGLRITDKKSGLAFAFVFGDSLVNDMFCGIDATQLIPSSFEEAFGDFLAKGMVVKRAEDGSVVIAKAGEEDEGGRKN